MSSLGVYFRTTVALCMLLLGTVFATECPSCVDQSGIYSGTFCGQLSASETSEPRVSRIQWVLDRCAPALQLTVAAEMEISGSYACYTEVADLYFNTSTEVGNPAWPRRLSLVLDEFELGDQYSFSFNISTVAHEASGIDISPTYGTDFYSSQYEGMTDYDFCWDYREIACSSSDECWGPFPTYIGLIISLLTFFLLTMLGCAARLCTQSNRVRKATQLRATAINSHFSHLVNE